MSWETEAAYQESCAARRVGPNSSISMPYSKAIPVNTIVAQEPQPPKLLDRLRALIRAKHYSIRTERVYAFWVKRFIRFHGMRHPQEMGKIEVEAYLTHLGCPQGTENFVR